MTYFNKRSYGERCEPVCIFNKLPLSFNKEFLQRSGPLVYVGG